MGEQVNKTEETPKSPLSADLTGTRPVLYRLGAVVLGIVLSLLILETGFRVILYRHAQYIDRLKEQASREWGGDLSLFQIVKPSTPTRVYELWPKAAGVFVDAPLSVNAAGYRDRPRTVEKPPGTFRIAVVGDSIAFGWGVPAEQRFSDVLEQILNEESPTTGTRFECLNLGIPGYNTVMELAMLREQGFAYAPDVLVLALVPNDDELPNFVRIRPKVWSLTTSFIAEAIRDQMIGRVFGDTARAAAGGIAETGGVGPASHVSGFRPELVPPEYRFLMGWDNMTRALCSMRMEAADRGARTICMMHHTELNALLDLPTSTALSANVNTRWFAEAARCGFETCDPLPALLEFLAARSLRQQALWVSKSDFHPNALAHALLARELYRTMLRLRLLPHVESWSAANPQIVRRWDQTVEKAAKGSGPGSPGSAGGPVK